MTNDNLPVSGPSFRSLGIEPSLLSVMERAGFVVPTPIQHKTIPVAIEGKDIVGIAQTGTGKTLAFSVPMIQRLMKMKSGGRGLVVLPTRELALQVDEAFRKIGRTLGLRTAVLIGGESIYRQVQSLRARPDVIIVTPGRLIDHLKQGNVKLDDIKILVLDEGDHMFDMGFAPQINEILKRVPRERQTMLFSATMPDAILSLATKNMLLPLRIEVAPSGTAAEKVEQEIIVVKKDQKFSLLVKLLTEQSGAVLVFSRTKYGTQKIARDLKTAGFSSAEIHSNRSLIQRRAALDGFKFGKYRVLVATDIAARGIDVKEIAMVVNYDLPENSEDYVHRIGRTARAGKAGLAVSFAMPEQGQDIRAIERLIKKTLPVKSHEGATMYEKSARLTSRGGYRAPSRSFGGSNRFSRGKGFGGKVPQRRGYR